MGSTKTTKVKEKPIRTVISDLSQKKGEGKTGRKEVAGEKRQEIS